MANPMGLTGANNPIFQISQQRAQESAANKNVAIQGIINNAMQGKTRQLAAEMESYNNLIQSKDPKLKMIGIKGLFDRAGKSVPPDIQQRFDEVTMASSDLAKIMNSKSLPDVKKQAWDAFISEYGADYISPEQAKNYQGTIAEGQQAQETSMLSQAAQIPELQKQGLLTPEQAAQGTQTALQGAGAKGQEVLAGMLKQENKPSKDINEFQTFKDSYLSTHPNATGEEIVKAYKNLIDRSGRDTYADTQLLSRLVDKYNADPNVRAVEKMDEFANLISDAALSDNPIAHSAIPTLMARASGEVGNLSEADKRPFGGSRALLSRMEQALTEMASGKRTTENIGYITNLADMFRNAGMNKKESLARERSKQYAKAYRGKFKEEEIFQMLSPGSEFKQNAPVPASKVEAPPVSGARKAPDGNWYVEKNGKYYKVE